jgi:hypothetical protein
MAALRLPQCRSRCQRCQRCQGCQGCQRASWLECADGEPCEFYLLSHLQDLSSGTYDMRRLFGHFNRYYLSGVFFDLFTPKNRAARDLFSAHLPGNFFGSKLGIPSQKLTFQHEFACQKPLLAVFPARLPCQKPLLRNSGNSKPLYRAGREQFRAQRAVRKLADSEPASQS